MASWQENIRNADYTRDCDLMFTVDDIDGRPGRFGIIRYFLSTGAVEVGRDKAGEKAVFRVLTKAR
ncbi:MAG: hypothetical protein ACHQAY_14735 [Hyphomicrobiales bacterium]